MADTGPGVTPRPAFFEEQTVAKKTADKNAITVQAKSAPYRRAGRAWSTDPTTVALADLTKEQLAALRADSNLVVTEAETAAAEGDES